MPTDILRVTFVKDFLLLVVSPILSARKEIGSSVPWPHERSIDFLYVRREIKLKWILLVIESVWTGHVIKVRVDVVIFTREDNLSLSTMDRLRVDGIETFWNSVLSVVPVSMEVWDLIGIA